MHILIPTRHRPAIDFAVQVIVGAVAFLVVFGAALLISIVLEAAKGITPPWLHRAANFSEMALFGLDLLCFASFILSETAKLILACWRG